jgi:capsular exopolysaccharide synthesis family protein
MGNYEALQRAEEERRQKASAGETAVPVSALDWDVTPKSAPASPTAKPGLFKRVFRRKDAAAEVPSMDANEVNKRRITMLRPESYVAEQFRSLRGRIEALSAQRPIRTIGMTSANPGEGKSTASINLGIVSSMSVDHKVVLVDCDLRRPTIAQTLGLSPKAGLGEVLTGRASIEEATSVVPNTDLSAICVRGQPDNPSELLASGEMQRFIEELIHRYDRVILDTPATLGLPDARIISDLCDGIVVVVRANKTAREEVNALLEILDRRKVLGMVLNGAEVERDTYGYY